MNNERPSVNERLRDKRVATAILLGITTVSLMAACSTETVPKPVPSVSEQAHATEPAEISLLKNYERKTGVAPEMMKFITMPSSEAEAREQASTLATELTAWSKADVSPLIIMEPTLDSGGLLDLRKLASGSYDATFATYFDTLKHAGITSEQMGTWVPLPEPNIPDWKSGITDPTLFSDNITRIAEPLKHSFPDAHVSIMLDSTTYLPSPDPDWNNGSTDTDLLLKYLDVKPGLIDSFGLQGFTSSNTDTPADYLNGEAAVAAAHRLGVKNVWFNTGTYKESYNPDDAKTPLAATTGRRVTVLSAVLTQAEVVQHAGLHVDMINIFGQNTYNGTDGTADFSYTSQSDLKTLHDFVDHAKTKSIPVTIFDAPK